MTFDAIHAFTKDNQYVSEEQLYTDDIKFCLSVIFSVTIDDL